MKHIQFFDEIDKRDLQLTGGKGANLGEMTRAGFPVPYGFCVTTEGYKAFLENNHLNEYISAQLSATSPSDPHHLNHSIGNLSCADPSTSSIADNCIHPHIANDTDTLTSAGELIRNKVLQSSIPNELIQQISEAISQLGEDCCYAVRSSATAEDLAFASFAGQQDTYLNIKGVQNILSAVRSCWASLFNDRALIYRHQNEIRHDKVFMSVVVQKMVLPEASGIMFTADPVTGHRGIISIDAGFGLGEALVSGLVTPDIYKYRKSTAAIESKTISHKAIAILPVEHEGGGTKRVELPDDKASSQVLTDAQISELAALGIKLEGHYGCPQDIEWCLEKGKLYIVQSRAITSLFPLPSPVPKDTALHVYMSFNHFQVMTDPISPLGIDMLRHITSFDSSARSPEDYKFVKAAAGRIYLDFSILLQFRKFGRKLAGFMTVADSLSSEAMLELLDRPGFYDNIVKYKAEAKTFRRFIFPILLKALKNFAFKAPENTVDKMNSYIRERVSRTSEYIQKAAPGIERLEAIYKAASFTSDFRKILPMMAPAMLSFKILQELEQKLLGSNKYFNIIVKGLEGNITTELGLLAGDLADLVRKSPELIHEFENPDYRTLADRIDRLDGLDELGGQNRSDGPDKPVGLQQYTEFKQKFNDFLNKYDMRAAGEIDIAKDRWIENPEPLANAILAAVRTSTEGIHRIEYATAIENSKKAATDLVREVRSKHGILKALLIKRLIHVFRNVFPIREHPKYLIMKLMLIFKKAFLEEARLLVSEGRLETEKDIFYLSFWELYDSNNLKELVRLRKEEYRHYSRLNPPRVLTSEGEEVKAGYKGKGLPEGAIQGMPVSSGVVEGIARVILNPAKETLEKGEILVTRFTDPGWTPLFINAAGLVTEVGGQLTHGTVVAREYGIPAVVGVIDATRKIKTGQRIKVDGTAGFVEICKGV